MTAPSNKPFDFVCVGSATQDVFVRSDASQILTLRDLREEHRLLAFDYGGKINVEHIEFTTGGGATNVAVSVARLGGKAIFIGKIGPDPVGQLILKELADHGVDLSYHLKTSDLSTGYSVILTSYEGDRTVLTHRGASTTIRPDEIDWSFIGKTKWAYVTSLAGTSAQVIEPLVAKAADAGVRIAFNPGSTQLRLGIGGLRNVLAKIDLLFLNKEEAERLTGIRAVHDTMVESRCAACGQCIGACPKGVFARNNNRVLASGVERCTKCGACIESCPSDALVMEPWAFNMAGSFRALADAGVKITVITDGGNGVQVSDGRTVWLMPAAEVPVVSTLGAGDAFGAAFAFEFSRTGDIGRAMALGTANAAGVVQVVGAKAGLLDQATAAAALNQFDPKQIRHHDLADLIEAAKKAADHA